MSDYSTIETSAEVWAVIKARHGAQLKVYSSFSDPTGERDGGHTGRMETAYALPGADFPLMEARTIWRIVPDSPNRADKVHQYWLCVPKESGND